EPPLEQELPRLGRPDVGPHQPRALGDVALAPAGEIVQHGHLPPGREVRLRHVRSDEAGAPGDENSAAHARVLSSRPGGRGSGGGRVNDRAARQYRRGARGGNRGLKPPNDRGAGPEVAAPRVDPAGEANVRSEASPPAAPASPEECRRTRRPARAPWPCARARAPPEPSRPGRPW